MKKLFALSLTAAICGFLLVPFGSGPYASNRSLARPFAAPNAGVGNGSAPCSSCAQVAEQMIYAPLITLAESSGTEINLNCRSPRTMEVTPTFYTRTGQAFVGERFEMQPAEVKTVDLKSLMPATIRNRQDLGGMTLSYMGLPLEMWGQLRLLRVGRGGSTDMLFNNLSVQRSSVRNAVWAMPERSAAVIAIGNAGSAPTKALLRFSNGDYQEVEVPAFGTELIRRRSEQHGAQSGAVGAQGLTVTAADGSGNLVFAGAVVSDDGKFTSSIRFYDTPNALQQNLFATNFRLHRVKASLLLRNTGTESITVTPRVRPVQGGPGDFIDLAAVTLSPDEIGNIDLGPLAAATQDRAEFAAVSIEIMNTGSRGSLVGALNGTDEITGMTYDVPLRDMGRLGSSTGAYPWRLDGDFSTIVSITNIAPGPSQFVVQINYPGGRYLLDPRRLPAGATATFDLRKIRDEQIPDRNGQTIPLSIEGGQFRWFIRGDGAGRLLGRAEMLSRTRRISSSYSCDTPCPPSFDRAWLNPDPTTVGVDEVEIQEALEIDVDGYGNEYGPFSANVVDWWSWDTSVATVYWGQVAGIAEGTTTTTATVEYPLYFWDSSTMDCSLFGYRQTDVYGTVEARGASVLCHRLTGMQGNDCLYEAIADCNVKCPNSGIRIAMSIVPGGFCQRYAVEIRRFRRDPNTGEVICPENGVARFSDTPCHSCYDLETVD